jgi:hypothetical protein
VPLDRETLLARFDGIRQFARGSRRAPHKPLLLLYALRSAADPPAEGSRRDLLAGRSLRSTIKAYGVGSKTVQRIKAELVDQTNA